MLDACLSGLEIASADIDAVSCADWWRREGFSCRRISGGHGSIHTFMLDACLSGLVIWKREDSCGRVVGWVGVPLPLPRQFIGNEVCCQCPGRRLMVSGSQL